jgi:hypothetical protein
MARAEARAQALLESEIVNQNGGLAPPFAFLVRPAKWPAKVGMRLALVLGMGSSKRLRPKHFALAPLAAGRFALALLAVSIGIFAIFSACVNGGRRPSAGPAERGASDATLAGHWRLVSPTDDKESVQAPRVLRLYINANQSREADYCDIGGARSQGAGQYELKNGTLTISYIGYRDAAHRTPDQEVEDLHYSGEITLLTADALELEGRYRYERYAPLADPITGTLRVGLCDNPPPTDDGAPAAGRAAASPMEATPPAS